MCNRGPNTVKRVEKVLRKHFFDHFVEYFVHFNATLLKVFVLIETHLGHVEQLLSDSCETFSQ